MSDLPVNALKPIYRGFKKEDLLDLLYKKELEIDGKLAKVVDGPNITDTSRWSIHYEMVFSYDDKYYSVVYRRGATESQDEQPFEYDGDVIQCIEVVPQKIMVIKYVPSRIVAPE